MNDLKSCVDGYVDDLTILFLCIVDMIEGRTTESESEEFESSESDGFQV